MAQDIAAAGCLVSTPCRARPEATDQVGQDDWFNIFVLHQNRISHAPGAKNYVMEHRLPPWLDLVIWGHEHECIPKEWVRGRWCIHAAVT